MQIKTSRFGEIEIDDQSIMSMPGGLIGFPDEERYVIIRHSPDSPFYWWQAVDNQDLAFVIVDPHVFKPDYKFDFSSALRSFLQADSIDDLNVFVIVTIPQGDPEGMTANLLGPIVINTKSRQSKQLVLDENLYSHRHPILAERTKEEKAGG